MTWLAPPAVMWSTALLPMICSPAMALAVKVVAAASVTVAMPVTLLPITPVPPPVSVSVLLPLPPPLMVTPASDAAATLKLFLPPPP